MRRAAVRQGPAGVLAGAFVAGGVALSRAVVESGRTLWRQRDDLAFDDLLLTGALCVVALVAGWLCVAVVVCVAAEALPLADDRARRMARRVAPAFCRRTVAAAFGAAAVAGSVGAHPAVGLEHGQEDRPRTCSAPACGASVHGLPSPDRPVPGILAARRPAYDPPARWLRVRRGDTLWSIAAARLPRHASDAEVAAAWPRWYRLNRARIGPDPHLIHPGTRLRAPSRSH